MPIEKEEIPAKCKVCKHLMRYTEVRFGKSAMYGCTLCSRTIKTGELFPVCEYIKCTRNKNDKD